MRFISAGVNIADSAGIVPRQKNAHTAQQSARMDTATAALLARFRALLKERGISQAELCLRLTKRTNHVWRDAYLSRLLNGHIGLLVEDLVLMVNAAGISLVELMREPGREYVADLTPSELQILTRIRAMGPEAVAALLRLLPPLPVKRGAQRRTTPTTRKQFYAPED